MEDLPCDPMITPPKSVDRSRTAFYTPPLITSTAPTEFQSPFHTPPCDHRALRKLHNTSGSEWRKSRECDSKDMLGDSSWNRILIKETSLRYGYNFYCLFGP